MRSSADDVWMTYVPADDMQMTYPPADNILDNIPICGWRADDVPDDVPDDIPDYVRMTPGVVLHEIGQLRQAAILNSSA